MSNKRQSDDSSTPTRIRSKRGRYSSVACQECRSRKLKCKRNQDNPACDRCIENEVECNITRPGRALNQASAFTRLEQCEQQIFLLRRQVTELASSRSTLTHDDANTTPELASSPPPFNHPHVEPHFIGTTRPAFSLKIAKASLTNMGVASDHEDTAEPQQWQPDTPSSITRIPDPIPPPPSSRELEARDPLLSISLPDVQRLVAVYQDEIQTIYPILDWSPAEEESRIPYLYDRARARSLGRFSGTREQKEVQLLKVILATALLLEEPGKASLSHELVRSVERDASSILAHPNVDLSEIRIIAIMAIYHFFCDQELYAWRTIGIAARLALEMGLHRKESLLQNFPDHQQRTAAVCLFWCVYILDRRWSLGTGLSFALVSRDIDPELPEPPASMPYLRSFVPYGHLCSKVWDALPHFGVGPHHAMPTVTASQLDYEIQNWFAGIPATFKLTSPYDVSSMALAAPCESSPFAPPRGPWSLRTLMYLRGNHLRLLVNRQYVLSSNTINANPQQARLVVHIARDSIRVIVALSKHTDIYCRQQEAYNHFLVSALAILLLAVSHAPALFAHHEACRNDFSEAMELVRGFSESSVAGRRLWKSMCGLVSAVSRLGELFDPNIYSTHAEPDMMHVGVDLMGLFDAFGQEYSNGAHPIGDEPIQDTTNSEFSSDFAPFSTERGGGVDEISRYFLGLI